MKKGSVTIFALLSLMLVVSALFALLEAGRFHQIKGLTNLQTQVALESAFAEYNTYLWEEYRVLACNQESLSKNIEMYGNQQIIESNEGINFFQFRVKEVELNQYSRLTDGEGVAFIVNTADYMEKNILYEAIQNIFDQYEVIKSIQNQSEYSFSNIEKMLEELNHAEVSKEIYKEESLQNESRVVGAKDSKNLLEFINDLQKKGILSLVLQEDDVVSEKTFKTTDKVSNRNLPEENHAMIESVDMNSKVLFHQYILTYLSNYKDEKQHAMDYEVEYVLVGKDSDVENLKGTISQLMGIRTASNFLYLSNNTAKQEQANLLAVSIAGISASPILIGGIKIAILTAWAFAESILDIRTLLSGGEISLLKKDSNWTLNIDAITNINEGFLKAKNCDGGLSYKDYLGILLLLQKDKDIALRTMDVQEQTLRENYKDVSICMEEWITDATISVKYGYQPVFFSIQKIIPSWNYELRATKSFGYYEG